MSTNSLLTVKNLKVYFSGEEILHKVINGVYLEIMPSEIVALVGGSGSGKTLTALSILRLLPEAAHIAEGKIIFQSRDLLKMNSEEMLRIRGKEIGMVFQEPLSAFNPLFTVGFQVEEVLRFHTSLSKREMHMRIRELLRQVGITDPEKVINDYPHQLSGGLRQRAMIAQAIAASPRLIIADEPTSNLDVTLQAQIMELFRSLKKELGISIFLITHDLAMVAHLADKVAVINQGKIVEFGKATEIMQNPRDIYSKQLAEAVRI